MRDKLELEAGDRSLKVTKLGKPIERVWTISCQDDIDELLHELDTTEEKVI